ncbi:nucleoside phosphorylase [Undibacterium sp. Tian12W]|uniref:phosphorylase family protein n=1 Tax=Undibacterium sp. Tian12W TaxID=3413054 RepID=UPI003BEF764B
MKIMLIEDDKHKAKIISDYVTSKGIDLDSIIFAENLAEVPAGLKHDIELFIIDLKLPSIPNGTATNSGKTILQMIVNSGQTNASLLAISSYPAEFPELRDEYESHGCVLADYSDPGKWKTALDHQLVRLKLQVRKEFIIFCALREERKPYIGLTEFSRENRFGVEFMDVTIGGRKGTIALLPQMGLVNAAVTAALCIDRLKPALVCMSGICGGFKDRAELGQLVFSTMAYEYQSGKWANDGFRQEPYQVKIDHLVDTMLKAMADEPGFLAALEKDFDGAHRAYTRSDVLPGIFTSGSAVIAQEKFMGQVASFHRKVHALDMEIYAVQRAAELSPRKPACICAKTVVDLGLEDKDDKLHPYGSYISAKFIIRAVEEFFAEFPDGVVKEK